MQTPVDRKWEPPIGVVMKINFDVAFHQHTNISVSEIIARNTEGLVFEHFCCVRIRRMWAKYVPKSANEKTQFVFQRASNTFYPPTNLFMPWSSVH